MSKQTEWRAVPDWPSYIVSDSGFVGRVRADRGARLLKQTVSKNGYPMVALSDKSRLRRFYVHHLVLMAFVGPRPEGMQAAHWNGDRCDARLANLRWDTPTNNCRDKIRHGTVNAGTRNGMARLTEARALAILGLRDAGVRYTRRLAAALAAKYGVSSSAIWFVWNNRTWRHCGKS